MGQCITDVRAPTTSWQCTSRTTTMNMPFSRRSAVAVSCGSTVAVGGVQRRRSISAVRSNPITSNQKIKINHGRSFVVTNADSTMTEWTWNVFRHVHHTERWTDKLQRHFASLYVSLYVYGPCYVFLMYVCVNKVALLRCIWIAKKVRNILWVTSAMLISQ